MLLVAGAALVGVLLGILALQSIDTGETWEEWRYEAAGGPWFNAAQFALVAMFVAGFVVGGEAGWVLIAVPAGACAVFFNFGVRRWLRRDRTVRASDVPLEDEDPQRPLWQRIALTVAWTAPLGAIVGILMFDTTADVVALTALSIFGGLLHELWLPALERRLKRRF